MLKQYVNDCWADGGDVVEEGGAGDLPAIDAGATPALLVNDEAKRRIKQILPEGLYDQNSKVSCSRLGRRVGNARKTMLILHLPFPL